ncbi:MAG TPA: DUF423 domain-containing protein [Bryobacteraceae bacterium]
MPFAALAAFLLAAAVGLGAFGAHALKERLDSYSLEVWEKAVFYHFIHALGMLIVASMAKLREPRADLICWLLLAGILLFSSSLYLLALTGTRALGAVTPLGGVAFLAAWLLLGWSLLRQ